MNSGAVHMDIVQDYSAEAVLLAMRRFGALRGCYASVFGISLCTFGFCDLVFDLCFWYFSVHVTIVCIFHN